MEYKPRSDYPCDDAIYFLVEAFSPLGARDKRHSVRASHPKRPQQAGALIGHMGQPLELKLAFIAFRLSN
jgi:hypothetical protein